MTKGVSGTEFNFRSNEKDNEQMIVDLGKLLINVCERVRGGIFVFFPSYLMID